MLDEEGQPVACFSLSVGLANMECYRRNVLAKRKRGGAGGGWGGLDLAWCRAWRAQQMVAAVVILVAVQCKGREPEP